MTSKGLFVTFEGRLDTITDSQVIKQIQYLKSIDIDMDLFIFDPIYSNYKKTKHHLKFFRPPNNINIFLFRAIRWRIPFSELFNAIYFLYCIKKTKSKYYYIHARSEYSTTVAVLLKFILKVKIIWDCRGDTYEEFLLKYRSPSVINKFILFYSYIVKFRIILSRMLCDNAIFVSKYLRKQVGTKKYPRHSTIIYNTAPKELFYFSNELRKKFRSILGYNKNDLVFIYSGSIVHYQSFNETIKIFRRIKSKLQNAKLIVLTPQVEKAINFLIDVRACDYIIKHVNYEEVNNYLNAADIGFMIREKNAVNKVASPTKYSEYCMAGLKIIMTDVVAQNYYLSIDVINNIIEYDLNKIPKDMNDPNLYGREKIAKIARRILSKDVMKNKYINLYKKL